jgi:hypothetical protein
MPGICMNSITQIHSNLSHPASHCSKWARYDFLSSVLSGMPGICMDSIMQIRSNLNHPASHCSKCARYDFPSTVLSSRPGICMDSIMQIHSNICHPASHCSKCARYVFASAVVSNKMAGICMDSIKVWCIKDQSKKSNYKLHRRKGTSLTLNCLWCTWTLWLSNMHSCTKANFCSIKPHFTAMLYIVIPNNFKSAEPIFILVLVLDLQGCQLHILFPLSYPIQEPLKPRGGRTLVERNLVESHF